MTYIANTDEDRRAMLAELGLDSVEDLFADVPAELRAESLDLAPGRSELEVLDHLRGLSEKNSTHLVSFLGGGFYDHFVPAAVDSILSRGEFFTAYTPYQPEGSQGTLQAIFEFQSAICRLTEMEVANASLYDGGTALYEAMMMAMRITRRRKIVVDKGVSPIYRNMLHCYTSNLSIDFEEVPTRDGLADRDEIAKRIDKETAAVMVQNPNFFGCIDDYSDLGQAAHDAGALMVVSAYPIALGILKTPGEMGADIAVGEGQSLGLPLSFGGPYLGYMAALQKHVRKMPGRIAGEAKDIEGKRGFVLTLQAREQHIRREKATSNICSNEALCALAASAYLTFLGKQGLREVAELCAAKAAYTRDRLLAIPGVTSRFDAPFFNEFVIDLPREAGDVIGKLIEKHLAAGFPLDRYYRDMGSSMLIAVTEKRTKEEIGMLADALEGIL